MSDLIPRNEFIGIRHVLVVEDEPLNSALMIAMLKIAGIDHVHICESGHALFRTLDTMPRVDLILLDLQLPGEDGFQVLQRIRHDVRFAAVPVLAVSAQVIVDTVKRAKACGFNGFIGKPLNFDRFPGQMRRALAGEEVWESR